MLPAVKGKPAIGPGTSRAKAGASLPRAGSSTNPVTKGKAKPGMGATKSLFGSSYQGGPAVEVSLPDV